MGKQKQVIPKELLEMITEKAAKVATENAITIAINVYKKEQEEQIQKQTEECRNNAKLLITHYRRMKKMKDTSVYDTNTVTDVTLAEIFNIMLGKIRLREFELSSTGRNRIITGMLINHIDVQLDNYRLECERSEESEINRRYRVVNMMYLEEKVIRVDEVARRENIDKSSVYRTLEKAYDDLAVLFFGIDGVRMISMKQMERREKKKGNREKI